MSDLIEIRWQAADGYVGKSRPQSFQFDPAEWWEEDYMPDGGEVEDALYQELREEFERTVTPEVNDHEVCLDAITAAQAARHAAWKGGASDE